MRTSFPPAIWGWTILTVVASFLSWGTFRPTNISGFPTGFPGELSAALFGNMTVSVDAWHGNLTLMGLQLPNWLPVVATVAAAYMVYVRSTGAQLSTRFVPALLFYSLAHVGAFSLLLLFSGRGALGIGAILMLLAIAGLMQAMMKIRPSSPHQVA